MRSTSFRMRSARRGMSSRLPMGVPTMYRQPPPDADPFDGERGVCGAEPCVGRFLDMDRSLARARRRLRRAWYTFRSRTRKKESFCASVRVQMPEMRPEDGKNRKRGRSTFEEVPALRRGEGRAVFRPGKLVLRAQLGFKKFQR